MKAKSNHWTNYWQSGKLTSLPQDFAQNYDGEIGLFWREAFEDLQADSKVLDLCTGNGAIALLAAEYSLQSGKQLTITGVDAAHIDKPLIEKNNPSLLQTLNKVRFISDCLVEDINLPKNSIDLMTSQYGIEYCDWDKTANKAQELLKTGGKLVFISHAASTSILAYMKIEQKQYDFLKQINLFKILEKYFSNSTGFGSTMKKLWAAKTKLQLEVGQNSSQLYAGVLQFLEHITVLEPTKFKTESCKIREYYEQHLFAYKRLQDILDVSQKIMDNGNWFCAFERAGLKLVASGEIVQSRVHNAGKYYHFVKP